MRAYSPEDFERLKVIVRLRKCGYSLQKIRYILRSAEWRKPGPYFLVAGNRMMAFSSAALVLERMLQLNSGVVLVVR